MIIPKDNLESQEVPTEKTDIQPTVHSVRTDELSEEELNGVAGGRRPLDGVCGCNPNGSCGCNPFSS